MLRHLRPTLVLAPDDAARALVAETIREPGLGFPAEWRVNVLALDRAPGAYQGR